MTRELDCVILTRDLQDERLRAGDVGTVVMVHGEGDAFDVEFVAWNGETIALVTLRASDVRPIGREMPHVRPLPEIGTSAGARLV